MSAPTVTAYEAANALIVTVLLVFAVWAVRFSWQRARAHDAARDAIRAASAEAPGIEVWDENAERWLRLPPGVQPGLGQYTDRDVAALDDLTIAWSAPAWDPATDPQWAAARARLHANLNDQQGD